MMHEVIVMLFLTALSGCSQSKRGGSWRVQMGLLLVLLKSKK